MNGEQLKKLKGYNKYSRKINLETLTHMKKSEIIKKYVELYGKKPTLQIDKNMSFDEYVKANRERPSNCLDCFIDCPIPFLCKQNACRKYTNQ